MREQLNHGKANSCQRQIIFLCIPPYNIIVKKKFLLFLLLVVVVLCVSCAGVGEFGETKLPEYTISATLDTKTMVLSGEVTLNYTYCGENTLSHLTFALYPNAKSENRAVEILSVSADGKQIGFTEKGDGDFLEIPLPRELFPSENIEVCINYELKIPKSSGIFGYSDTETKLSGWYPLLCARVGDEWVEQTLDGFGDCYFSDVANYEVRLTVGRDETVVSSGKRVGVINSESNTTYTFVAERVRDFAFCVSSKYLCVSGVSGVTLISAYAYDSETAQEILRYAKQAFGFFREEYGELDIPTFSVALCDLSAGGMEFSGLVYICKELKGRELEEVVAHETAHQWWYGGVGSNPTEYAWLDEGLTEYAVLEYIGRFYGVLEREKKVKDAYTLYDAYVDVAKNLGQIDFGLTKNTAEFTTLYHYVVITYTKGALFFENLREITGDKNFKKAIKTYFCTFKHKIATPDDLKECLQNTVPKINFTPIFDYWT